MNVITMYEVEKVYILTLKIQLAYTFLSVP